jgi:tetratricopeptide (TPR) repeat protein
MILMAHEFRDEADACLRQASKLDPREFRWPYLLGLHRSVSRLDEAIWHWQRAAEIQPSDSVVRLRLGEAFFQQGQIEQAAAQFNEAVRIAPSRPRVALDMARLALARGDPTGSVDWAEAAAKLAPECGEIHRLLAQAHRQAGDLEAARAAFELADRFPNDLGWDDPIAAEVLALRRDAHAMVQTAEQLLQQDQFRQAIALLEAVLAKDEREPQVFAVLGRALVQAGKFPRADEVLARGVARHPDSPDVWFQRGGVQFHLKRFAAAEASFRAAIERKPDFALAHFNLAHACEQQNRFDDAIGSLRNAIRFRPGYAPAHLNLGRLLLKRGERDAALEHLRRAEKLDPGNAIVKRLLNEVESP